MPGTFRVIALTYSVGSAKKKGCKIIAGDEKYPHIYSPIFGPATKKDCEHFIKLHCGGAEDDAMRNHDANITKILSGYVCRCYKAGEPLTEECNPERINIERDVEGRIVSVWFG